MASVFTRIINREIPAQILAEDARFIAFLDVMPLVRGHALVVPKQEIDYIFDLDEDALGAMTVFAKPLAAAIRASVPCKRIGIAVIGLEVPHAHMHLVPMNTANDLNFTQPKLSLTPQELAAIGDKIRAALGA